MSLKKVLITGADGQLGLSIQKRADQYPSLQFLYTDIDSLDVGKKEDVKEFIKSNQIDYIVNCAAYTAVDNAEDEEAKAYRINCYALQNLAEVAFETNVRVIHISTDYVFDGKHHSPYKETDATHPTSSYGRTKLAGEQVLMEVCPASVIIRTAWLYSEFGNNFMKTMLRLGAEREVVKVVFDQVGTPTYAGDLATTILELLSKAENDKFLPGIYHYSNEGVCSWYDFARKIMELAELKARVVPIETKDYPTPATRPAFSVLNKIKIKETYQIEIPHWEDSLREVIRNYKA